MGEISSYWLSVHAQQKSLLENERNKILCDFEIKTDPPILARRPDILLID